MSEMIERVANALALWNTPNMGLEERSAEGQAPLRAKARAAIQAMREPTAEMIDALPKVGLLSVSDQTDYIVRDYRKMIDAALGDKP